MRLVDFQPQLRQNYRSHHAEAVVERTAEVEGHPLALYRMSDDREPWPALADVRHLLDGFTCRILEVGTGLDRLTVGSDFLLDVVSPIATAAAVNLALQAGRITPARADALLIAVGGEGRMNGPNSYNRHSVVARTIEVGGLDLYAPAAGPGWKTPADPIYTLAGIPEPNRLDILPRLGLTGALGAEIVWHHPRPVALLSRNAVAAVLANAVAEVDPATVAAIDAALAG